MPETARFGEMMQDALIDRLGPEGEGITTAGVRIPFTLPGERVSGDGAGAPQIITAPPPTG